MYLPLTAPYLPACILDASESLHDRKVIDFRGHYTILIYIYDFNGEKIVLGRAFAKENSNLIVKQRQGIQTNGKPHLHCNISNMECISSKAHFFGCMLGSETSERKAMFLPAVLLYHFRAPQVGLNQILIRPALSQDTNNFRQIYQ